MATIPRKMADHINVYLARDEEHANVLLVSGARQVGKTTLIEDVLHGQKTIILNLSERTTLPRLIDDAQSFEELERLLFREVNFRPSEGTIIVFDEAQEAKNLGRWIRFFKERWTRQKVIVSGSILSNLFAQGVAYPVGRVEEITLRPFTFKEYLVAIQKQGLREILESISFTQPLSQKDREAFIKQYLSYLQTGGMPDVVIGVNGGVESAYAAWDRLLRQYALDVERHMEEIYKTMFVSAMDRIADITCHPIKNSQIISIQSPSYRKLPWLLEILEKWHIVHKVAAQTKYPESASGLASKRYLFDVGLTNFFINQSQTVEWQDRSDTGNIMYPKLQEAFVCNELIAIFDAPLAAMNYYRETRNSKEVDFIVPIGGAIVPIEVKSQGSFGRNSLIPMINFLKGRNLSVGVLVYNGEMRQIPIEGRVIHAIPPYLVSELPRMLSAIV